MLSAGINSAYIPISNIKSIKMWYLKEEKLRVYWLNLRT